MAAIADKDLGLDWVSFGQHLKVYGTGKELLFNSVTSFVSPKLTQSQVKWISEHYQKTRKNYVF